MNASTVPAVLSALLTPFGSTPAFLGEPLQRQPGDFVAVAWAGPDNDAVQMVEGDLTAAAAQREVYTVAIQLVAWEGSPNLGACITRVYALLDQLVAYVITDKTLGGKCMQANVIEAGLHPNQTQQGAIATLGVTVRVQATK